MKFHLVLGLFTAPLAAVIAQFSAPWGLIGWVVFLTWASFFAAGAKTNAFIRVIISSLIGLIGGYAVVELGAMSTMSNPLLVPMAGVIFVIVLLGSCKQFFIPAAFVGCASYMGAGALLWETFVSLILGAILAYITHSLALMIVKKENA